MNGQTMNGSTTNGSIASGSTTETTAPIEDGGLGGTLAYALR
jgi:hypothetical protein